MVLSGSGGEARAAPELSHTQMLLGEHSDIQAIETRTAHHFRSAPGHGARNLAHTMRRRLIGSRRNHIVRASAANGEIKFRQKKSNMTHKKRRIGEIVKHAPVPTPGHVLGRLASPLHTSVGARSTLCPRRAQLPKPADVAGGLSQQPIAERHDLWEARGSLRANDPIGLGQPQFLGERAQQSPGDQIGCRQGRPRKRNALAVDRSIDRHAHPIKNGAMRELGRRETVSLVLHLPSEERQRVDVRGLGDAIRHYFAYRLWGERRRLRHEMRLGLASLAHHLEAWRDDPDPLLRETVRQARRQLG